MKISLKMKNKDKLNIEKNITKYGEIKILHRLKVLTLSSKYKKLLFQISIEKFKQVKLLVFSNWSQKSFSFFFLFFRKVWEIFSWGKYKKCLGEPSDSFFQTDAKKLIMVGSIINFFMELKIISLWHLG